MEYKYSVGEGKPPLFVSDIQNYREKKLVLKGDNKEIIQEITKSEFSQFLKNKKKTEITFILSNVGDLQKLCLWLAKRRVCFSVGGMASYGPATIIKEFLDTGVFSETFLEISWSGPEKWQIYEIGPTEIQEWKKTSVENLLTTRNNEHNKSRV